VIIEVALSLSSPSGAPVYISNPHFYQSNPKFLKEVEGLKPEKELHETYFKIQPVSRPLARSCGRPSTCSNPFQTLGVPVEGKVRVQLNLRVEQAKNVQAVSKFRDIVFPIMWLEEVKSDLLIGRRSNGRSHEADLIIQLR
jgi:scavenger receptor class B, member 1